MGVWVGNFSASGMDHLASTAAAAPLWRTMIEDLLTNDHGVPAPTLKPMPICSLSGLLPAGASPSTLNELFLPGTEPHDSADPWFDVGGHPLLPAEYARWCDSPNNRLGATLRPDIEELKVISPKDGATFLIDDDLPPGQQQIEFRTAAAEHVTWSINSSPLLPRVDGRIFWQMQEGDWEFEAIAGQTRTTGRFTVLRQDLAKVSQVR